MIFERVPSVFKKHQKNGKNDYYYYEIYDPETGKRRTFSTGCTTKLKAREVVEKRWKEGTLIPDRHGKILFKDFVAKYFGENGKYEKMLKLRGGINKDKTKDSRNSLIKLVIPCFGDVRLENIRPIHINDFLMNMKEHGNKGKGCSSSTLNQYKKILSMIFNVAIEDKLIKENPCNEAITVSTKDVKARGILTENEANTLFNPTRIGEIWKGNRMMWAFCYLAYCTGMRLGEIQALTFNNVVQGYNEKGEITYKIVISRNWNERHKKIITPKNGETRFFPINGQLYEILQSIADSKDSFIFLGENEYPVSASSVQDYYKYSLSKIGITEQERKERKIVFHSSRHYKNTELACHGMDNLIIQKLIGHSDVKMTQHYFKPDESALRDILIKANCL